MAAAAASENYIVKPVAKALQVLAYVAQEGRELALTECYKVRLPKTTVFRYLQRARAAWARPFLVPAARSSPA